MPIQINAQQAKEIIPEILQAKLTAMLHGSPAIGKSAIVREIAEEYNLKMIDIRLSQLDPTDLNGFPKLDGNRATYVPMDTFPLQGDELPRKPNSKERYSGWLLFMDEFPLAPPAVAKAAYRIILDREVGQYPLHERVLCIGAGNLVTDNAMVDEMPTPLQSRMVHLELVADAKIWLDWASRQKVDYRITSFINWKPDLIYDFKPEHSDRTYASPRTWSFVDKLIRGKDLSAKHYMPLLAGTVGEGVAREFLQFCRIHKDLPKIEQIISNPEGVAVPVEPSILYALTGALSNHADTKTVAPIMRYIHRMPPEFQVIALRDLVRRNSVMMKEKAVQEWIAHNAIELF